MRDFTLIDTAIVLFFIVYHHLHFNVTSFLRFCIDDLAAKIIILKTAIILAAQLTLVLNTLCRRFSAERQRSGGLSTR